jgi:hypothetical protein
MNIAVFETEVFQASRKLDERKKARKINISSKSSSNEQRVEKVSFLLNRIRNLIRLILI